LPEISHLIRLFSTLQPFGPLQGVLMSVPFSHTNKLFSSKQEGEVPEQESPGFFLQHPTASRPATKTVAMAIREWFMR
jgi:hypothetical protein